MKLVSVEIQHYRCISDSGEVKINDDVTCFVGKNESGKTAFLRALHLLNPLNPIKGKKEFDPVMDYPGKDYGKYKKLTGDDAKQAVVTATFELSDTEVATIQDEFGPNSVSVTKFTVQAGYGSAGTTYSPIMNEAETVKFLSANLELLEDDKSKLAATKSIYALRTFLEKIEEPHSTATALLAVINGWRLKSLAHKVIDAFLTPWLPKFFYFDDYSTMPGRVGLEKLRAKPEASWSEGERAFIAFLAMGGTDLESFASGTRTEAMFRELENASIAITEEAMEFWSQNQDLKVNVRESQADPKDEDPQLRDGVVMNLRIANTRTGVSSPFDERSRGFVWFFSFLAYFTGIEADHSKERIILLLDEPGLSLHGSAQEDFLRFINDRLSPTHQVLYTTHSPFLIEPDRFERVRTVEEIQGSGTKVSSDVFKSQPSTALPILTAMGIELYQTLMVGPHTLLVEGGSDYLYLQLLSQEMRRRGKPSLDERWVIVPVASSSKFAPYFALYEANKLNVAVLMDSTTQDKKLAEALRKDTKTGHVVMIGEALGKEDADIEDLVGEEVYAEIVAGFYALKPIKLKGMTSKHPRIAKRLEEEFINLGAPAETRFSHLEPANYLREHKELLEGMTDDAVEASSKLFETLNALIVE